LKRAQQLWRFESHAPTSTRPTHASPDVERIAHRAITVATQEIDTLLRKVARNWGLERMAVVDRNILRMATWEMLYSRDVPPKVAINEAIELGKRYSTANSGAFVNGILDRIRIDKVDAAAGSAEASVETASE
jgi:transcription antitermination factor NusB